MTRPLPRVLAVCVAGAVGVALAQAPASAASAFSSINLDHSIGTYVSSSATCPSTTPSPTEPSRKAIPQNGTTVRSAVSGSQSWRSSTDATDTATLAVSTSGSVRATSIGSTPKSIELSFAGQATTTTSKPAGFACTLRGSAALGTSFEFTIARPLIATLSYQRTGAAGIDAGIFDEDNSDSYEQLFGATLAGNGAATTYLPPGHYSGYLGGGVSMARTAVKKRVTASGSATITFVVPGSVAASAKGKARKLVTLPTARSCAAHTATPRLTTKAKKLKKAKKITFTVNGKKAKTLKGKKLKKGKVVAIPIADKATAKLGVTVKLKNGKKVTASATYNPCA